MKAIHLSNKVSIPSTVFATQGNAILGLRKSGKSYSATYLAEQLMAEKIPFTAFDPIGVWRNLKLPGKGHGWPVVVVGDDADLPLNPKAIPDIVRAAMREGINLVIDLFSIKLSKADWRVIVEQAVTIMLHENKAHGLRHIFLEEAAEFVPQIVRPDQAKVYSVMEKLARMGGNASLGYTLVNQRAEAVNKELLENCDMVFLHKQRGRNSVANLSKWLKSISPESAAQVEDSLPHLKSGECWILTSDATEFQFVRMPEKQSFHPDRENPAAVKPSGKTVDVSRWIEQLHAAIKKHEPVAPPAKPATIVPAPAPIIREVEKIVEVPILTDADRMLISGTKDFLEKTLPALTALVQRADQALLAVKNRPALAQGRPLVTRSKAVAIATRTPKALVAQAAGNGHADGDELAKLAAKILNGRSGEKRMMVALAQRMPLTRGQLSMRAKVSQKGGSFDTYVSRLSQLGWIGREGGDFVLTEEGRSNLGNDFEPLPTGQALLEHYIRQFGDSGSARMLAVLAEAYPNSLSREELGQMAEVSPSGGSFDTYISRLATLELITKERGAFKASDEFFTA